MNCPSAVTRLLADGLAGLIVSVDVGRNVVIPIDRT